MRSWLHRRPLRAAMLVSALLGLITTAGPVASASGSATLLVLRLLVGALVGALLGLSCALAGSAVRTALRGLLPSVGSRVEALAVAAGASVLAGLLVAATAGDADTSIASWSIPLPAFLSAGLAAGGLALAVALPPGVRRDRRPTGEEPHGSPPGV